MIIHEIEQRSAEWHELKRGKFSASNFDKLMMTNSTQGYNDLINQIVFERITNKSVEHYTNAEMERGTLLEPEARENYELETFTKVKSVGFVELNEWVGVSPDGLIGSKGLLEIKCPKWNTHLSYKLNGGLPNAYKWQVQGQMFVTEREWVDFFSYHPDLEPYLFREYRNEDLISQLKDKLKIAIQEVDNRIKKLKGQ